MRGTIEERLWSKVCKTEACWLWQAHGVGGYGRIRHEGRMQLAHRVAYALAFGPVDPSVKVLHKCDTPACVRPDHLFRGSQANNIADQFAKGRNPSRAGVSNGNAKLSAADVDYIRSRKWSGTKKALAARFNITRGALHKVLKGFTWSNGKTV